MDFNNLIMELKYSHAHAGSGHEKGNVEKRLGLYKEGFRQKNADLPR